MKKIKKQIAIVKIKKPFFDWIKKHDIENIFHSIDEINSFPTLIILPSEKRCLDIEGYFETIYKELWSKKLKSYLRDKTKWPDIDTIDDFWDWFDILPAGDSYDTTK
jgi:hypothetical protein